MQVLIGFLAGQRKQHIQPLPVVDHLRKDLILIIPQAAVLSIPDMHAGLIAIDVGSDADITVIDPNVKQVWSAKLHHMQTDFSPFEGMELTGKVMHTIVRGEPIICDGKFTGTSFRGRKMERSSPILD